MTLRARSRASAGSTPVSSSPKATSSSTVFLQIWRSGFWKRVATCAAMRETGVSRVSSPAMPDLARRGLQQAVQKLVVSVVLPAPFWPTTPTSSPGYTVSERSVTLAPPPG